MQALTIFFYILIFIALIIFLSWYKSPKRIRKKGEKKVFNYLLQLSDDYHIINDVVFKTNKGTTQIDHIVVSKYGVFAIETKNYRGEIYGDDNREEWTQIIVTEVTYQRKWWKTYTYVTKNHFYNPVKQSMGHAFRIKEILKDYKHLPIVPIVVFVGDAVFSDVRTKYRVIYAKQLLQVIEEYKTTYLSDDEYHNVIKTLQDNNIRELIDNKTHIGNINSERHKRQDTVNAGLCPKCGGKLVLRSGRYGDFYGCTNYPKCKFTVNIG